MKKSSKGPKNQPKLTNFFGSNPSSHSEKQNESEVVVSNGNYEFCNTYFDFARPSSSNTKICTSTGVKPKTNIAARSVRCPTDLSPVGSTRPIMTSQSLKGLELPKSQIDNRSFQPIWLDKFNWLEYSVSHDAAFCFSCRCFKLKSVKEPVFTESGFTSWKAALVQNKGFKRRESSPGHVEAMCSWLEKKLLRDANENPVTELLVSSTLQKRRFYMKAIRGNWDSAEHRENGIFCFVICNFFRRSKVEAYYQGSSILKLITTRWAGHNRATNAIFNNYSEVIDALSQVKRNKKYKFDGEDLALASGIMSTIQKLNFLFMLVFMKEYLNTIAPADKILQSRDIGFRESIPVIRDVLSKIVQLRNQESFDRILESAKSMMPEVSFDKILEGDENVMPKEDIFVNQARPTRNKKRPVGLHDFILTEQTGERNAEPLIEIKSAYFEIIDVFKSEFTKRFEENEEILLAISEAGEFSIEKLQPLRQLGLELPSAEELAVAKSYFDRKRTEYEKKRSENEDTKFKTRFNLLEQLYVMRDAFPNVYKLMATVDRFGCSTTVCKCSFSALDRVGTKPRIIMGSARLRNLSFLAFEHKTVAQISTDEILKKLNDNPQRRIQLY